MHGFDLDQLRTFVTVIEAGSLTAAVPLRFRSQSSLSEQLRKLEAHAGQELLLRSKSGVTPTAAGQRLLMHARKILAVSEEAWRDMRGAPLAGELRLGISEYFRPTDLIRLLANLHHQHPQIRLHVRLDKSDVLHAAYAGEELDVVVSMQITGQSRRATSGAVLRREPLHWAGGKGMELTKGSPLRLVALPSSCALRRLAVETLEKRKIPYVVAHVASGIAGLQSAVAAELGIACLNAASLGGDVLPLPRSWGLPALPHVVFKITGARPDEDARVGAIRTLVETTLQR